MQTRSPARQGQDRVEPAVMMAVSLARLLRDGETVFHGVASPLPMVAILIARQLHAPNLIYLNITGGVNSWPQELPESTVDPSLLRGVRSMVTLTDVFDLSSRGKLDTAFLGGAQIDARGRINLSVIGEFAKPKVRLPGGAGSAALMPTARRTILWRTRHDQRTFVSQLPFVTAAGNVDRVVTPLCIFRRIDGQLEVESIHPGVSAEELRENTEFDVRVTAETPVSAAPTTVELEALQRVDPAGIVRIEFSR